MGTGKNLVFFGGIITIIGTYLFSWFQFTYINAQYAYGVGGLINFKDLIVPTKFYRERLDMDGWLISVIAVFVLFFLISGILQLIGKKNRLVGLVGTIMPLIMGVMLVLGGTVSLFGIILRYLEIYGSPDALIEGILPIHVIMYGKAALGSFLVLTGGVLGIIGVIISKEEFY